ncbi:unnamed protein product [Cyclocybe aegerita]|uniref:ML-like domain-containing protein n=1 Tax=Cyclocybe aegerita TaxID=1973307 RepID=A0A8S0WNS8_CYCAE|nr:unnamed protein product [Cyclocybe aegerita]
MPSPLAWPRALAISLLSLLTLAPYSNAREESLFTSSVTYCNPPETLLIQRFEIAYFPSNTSVSFNVSAASVQPNVNVTANLFLNVYGMNPVNVTLDLCNILNGALCPLPMYNFTGADSLTLPASLGVVDRIPGIAYKIPDLEGFAQLTLTEVQTGTVRACVQATLANGRSAHQPAVEWTTGGVALAGLLAAVWQSILSPDSILPFRLLELMYLYQSIASSSFLNLNYPSVYRAFALNFAWASGLISTGSESSLQNSINRMRHLTGGKLADASSGSAVGLVNRKLSPYNSPSTNLAVQDSFDNFATTSNLFEGISSATFSGLKESNLSTYIKANTLETIKNGEVQTVTAVSSNVLQAGVPIYVNSIHIATANAFMTVFLIVLCLFAIAAAVFAIGYGIMSLVERKRSRAHKSAVPLGFDCPSFVMSWVLRLGLIVLFPLLIFIFYQWTLDDSWLSILLSVLTFLAISSLIIYPSYVTLRFARQESPFALYNKDSQQLARYGPLYAQYRVERYYFFLPLLAAFFLRALFIAFAKGSTEAQLSLMIIVEFGLVAAHFVLKPAHTKGGDVFTSYLAITRFVCTVLMIAFIQRLEVKAIPRVVIGIIVAIAWSFSVLVVIGNIVWNLGLVFLRRRVRRDRNDSSSTLGSPARSDGSMLEKGIRGNHNGSTKSGHDEKNDPSVSYVNAADDASDAIDEVARSRPINPTPEHNILLDPYILTPYPISPTGSTVTTMDPPSVYTRDSGTLTVGSLLPRRWSFSLSQPGSPGSSSLGHQQQRGSLTSSLPPSTPSDASHSAGVSRNTSVRVQHHLQTHEDIQEEETTSHFTNTSPSTNPAAAPTKAPVPVS